MVRIEPSEMITVELMSMLLNCLEEILLTFCFVLWNEERALLKLETFRSLASRLISLAESLTSSWSGSGRQRVLLT